MAVRHVVLALVVVAGCGRREEPLLTPPPPPTASVQPVPIAPVAQPVQPAQPAQGTQPAQPEQIRASHILIMHRESRGAPPHITRSKEEARARAQEVLDKVRRGEDFAALARQYSDEPGADRTGGDLNRFGRGVMVAPFEQAAFSLRVGEISDIVETPFGFHIIKRTE